MCKQTSQRLPTSGMMWSCTLQAVHVHAGQGLLSMNASILRSGVHAKSTQAHL